MSAATQIPIKKCFLTRGDYTVAVNWLQDFRNGDIKTAPRCINK
ncbi:hypothetical protein GPAL_3329 [Glaciecola pallidula DSM 14239 = ACAM 615]|uniref:Uncharacterized protein n=1 Tax=Brumicola pallidula DSM 14239 = ACAM 615 TaxID=1121922 RepID=K6ZII9_9ALTE|nr:hypothetical protein GPAL_3329 [Glaciecola pallidula DSM 14239 = ACAM 615]